MKYRHYIQSPFNPDRKLQIPNLVMQTSQRPNPFTFLLVRGSGSRIEEPKQSFRRYGEVKILGTQV